jgi:hypothetical protein
MRVLRFLMLTQVQGHLANCQNCHVTQKAQDYTFRYEYLLQSVLSQLN